MTELTFFLRPLSVKVRTFSFLEKGEAGAINVSLSQCILLAYWENTLSVYVALTYIPGGGLLTGFAMRSDPNVAFDYITTAETQEHCDSSGSC